MTSREIHEAHVADSFRAGEHLASERESFVAACLVPKQSPVDSFIEGLASIHRSSLIQAILYMQNPLTHAELEVTLSARLTTQQANDMLYYLLASLGTRDLTDAEVSKGIVLAREHGLRT